MPNRLSTETSPYLLQHAHNPVDWYPWCDEAFEKARLENKPVLVSIGYAACHWCHVMERESFENEEVAALMNQHFVNIKVDREERPDVDHIYMDAVQAISGSGGWPLNVFLTPERRPFYGGTYFPPKRAFNRPSWTELLQSIAHSFKEKRDEVEEQAANLTQHLKVSNDFGVNAGQTAINEALVEEAFVNIMKTADKEWGGFGRAPKFPQTFTISFLLHYAHFTGNEQAKTQALLSLDKMMEGGIYDQVGGGFARYSTDTEWLAPHFEKMLYDNALLVQVLADAYLMTKDERYRRVMEETLAFVERELTHEQGGFYSALDADSEGVEGKFYVWELDEVRQLLGEDADLFCRYYDITEKGNWEGKNILRILMPLAAFAGANDKDEKELAAIMDRGRKILLEARGKRIRPALDDKIILGWNALMNIAYSKAYAATGDVHFLKVAEKNIRFLMESYQGDHGLLHHSWKNGEARHPAFLDDYAGFIAALTELAQVSADFGYFGKARELVNTVLDNFGDEASPFFLYTHKGQQDVLIRKKEVYDGATPSGNALMAGNLHKLSQVYDEASWRERSEAMTGAMAGVAGRYPGSFGLWLAVIYEQLKGTKEIALVGKEAKNYLGQTLGIFIPYKLIMASSTASESWPLLAGKAENDEINIYLCENYACRQPVSTMVEFREVLHS